MRPQPFFNLQAFRVSALGWQPAQPTLALLRSSLEMEKQKTKKQKNSIIEIATFLHCSVCCCGCFVTRGYQKNTSDMHQQTS